MTRRTLPQKHGGRDRPQTAIAPSILSSDFAQLAQECERMIKSGADWLHVDVMDGHFVPNLTLGPPIVKALRKHTEAFLDCHLMVAHPGDWVDSFAQAGADMFTFHLEAVADPTVMGSRDEKVMELIGRIKEVGMHVGMAVKPGTSVDNVLPYVPDLDLVLILTVEPGFGGQAFMEDKVTKCRKVREMSQEVQIEVDGGLAPSTIDKAAAEGANVIVAGSAIFGAADAEAVIEVLRDSVDKAASGA